MAEYIKLPDGSFLELKEGQSALEGRMAAKQLYPELFKTESETPKRDTTGFKAAAAAGFERLGGEFELLKGKTGFKSEAEAQKEYEAAQKRAQERFTPTEKGWTEAPFLKFRETLGGSVPYMAAPAAAGLAALAAPVAAPTAAALGLGAAGLTSAGQFTGSNLARQVETGKSLEETSLGAAAAAAVPQALIDTAAMALLPGVGKLFGSVGSKLTTEQAKAIASQTLGRTVADYTAKTGTAMGREGFTEVVQQSLERLQAGLNITDPEARKEYIDSFIGGAVLGGAIAPVGRAIERGSAKDQAAKANAEETRAARTAAAEQERVAKEQQTAADEAERNSAPYALKVEQDYLAAEQQKEALKAQIKKGTKEEPLNEAAKAFNADINAQLKELQPTVKALGQEFNRTAKTRAQAQEQARLDAMSPEDFMLEQTMQGEGMQAADRAKRKKGELFEREVAPPAPVDTSVQDYATSQIEAARSMGAMGIDEYADFLMQDPTMADQMIKTRTKMPDLTRQENALLIDGLKLRLDAQKKAEQAQRAAESARLQTAGQTRLAGVEEEEQAALAQAEAERQAAAQEAQREAALGGERYSLQKMRVAQGAPQNVFDETAPYSLGPKLSDQFGLFGEEQAAPTPGIAPIGQMRQKLLGEDVTFTAEEEQKRNLRRVPGSEFKLRPRAEGTGAPVTRDELADRINTVLSTYDLSPEAGELLQRVEKAMPQKLAPEYAQMLDQQLGLIESGQEGVPRKGADRPAMLQAFPAAGARAETAAPTTAFKYEQESLRSAQPGQAQTAGRRVTQPEGERVAAETGETPVQKRVSDITPRTLRGESAAPAPLSTLAADRNKERSPLVEFLRMAEQAAAVDTDQMDLFDKKDEIARQKAATKEGKPVGMPLGRGTTKESPEAFRRVQDAPTARKVRKNLREAEAAKKPQTAAEKTRAEQGAKDAELLQYKRDLSDARAKFINDVLEQQRAFEEKAKTLPGDGGQARIRRVRALSELERDAREKGLTADAAQGIQYKNELYNKDAGWLLREIGKVEKRFREVTDQVNAAKKKSATYTGDIAMVKAFKGQASAIRALSRLSVQLDALNSAYDLRSGAAQPRVTSALRVEEKERARPEEQEEVDAELERVQMYGVRKERLDTLKEQLAAAKKDGTEKSVQRLSADIIKAEKELAEVAPQPLKGKVTQASRVQTSAPGKLRAGTEESKKATGSVKRPIVEGRTEKLPTTKQAVAEGNIASLLKRAAEKPKTVAEIKALSMEQDRVVTEAQQKLVDDLRIQKNKLEEEVRALEGLQAKGSTRGTAESLKTKLKQLQQVSKAFNHADKTLKKYYNATVGGTDVSAVEGTEMRGTASRTMKLFDDDFDTDALYRVADTTGPSMSVAQVQKVYDALTGDWTNKPQTVVVADEKGLPIRIRNQAERDNMTGKIPGLYDPTSGKVYLVASNLRSVNDVILTTVHEIAGHFGLQKVLGDTYNQTMNAIYSGNAAIRKAADAKLKQIASLKRETAVEEALAEQAELDPNAPDTRSAMRKIYDTVKKWLRDTFGLKDTVTDEQVNQLIANARKFVIEGGEAGIGSAGITAPSYRSKQAAPATPAHDALADKIVAQPKTFKQKLGSNLALEAEMQGVDMRAGLRDVLKAGAKEMGDDKLFTQAMYNVLKSDQKMPLIYTVMSNGPLETYRDDKGLIGVRSTNKHSAKDVYDAVAALPGKDAAQKDRLATAYMVAQRASNKGLEKLDVGALDVKQADLDAVLAEAEANDELRAGLEAVRTAYNAYNKGMIDFLATTGAIPKAVAKKLNEAGDYVPFYRVDANGMADLVFSDDAMITIGDIRRQPYLAELKGGEQRILPLSEALPRNTILLTDKALTNMATKGVAYGLQSIGAAQDKMKIQRGKGPADPRTIRFNQEPDPKDPDDTGERFLRVDTEGTLAEGVPSELLVKSLEGSHLPLPGFLKLAGVATDYLRAGVTRTPLYIARQLIREPMAAAFTGGLNYNAFTAVLKGGMKFVQMTRGSTDAEAKLLEKGLIQSGIFTGDVDDMKKFSLQLVKGDQNALEKLFAFADRQAIKADAATRSLVYENALANGLSEVEADFMTMESMNFYKRGLSPSVQYFGRLIPFFNAQIQGLNVLAKAARGNMPFEQQQQIKRKFFNNAVLMMASGIAYAMAMEDDETWRNARPRDKMTNFFIPLPGTDELLKLPIPFEAGYFYSLAVAAVEGMREQTDNKEQWAAIKDLFINSIPGASSMGVPQIVKPIAEVWTNKNFMSGNEIESRRLQGLATEERYNATTTELAKQMSKALPILSPIQIEHIVRGYFGVLPLAVVATANGLFEREGKGEKPEKLLSETALVGSAFQKKFGGADSDVAFRMAGDAIDARATLNKMLSEGRKEAAVAYRDKNRAEIQSASAAGQYRQLVGRINADQRRTQERTDLTAAEKRARIDKLDEAKQQAAQRFTSLVRRIEDVEE